MPPKSTDNKDAAPLSRRSARLSAAPASTKQEEPKKREREGAASAPSKKAKPSSAAPKSGSKAETASKNDTNGAPIAEEDAPANESAKDDKAAATSAAAKEKEAKAPAEAEAQDDGAGKLKEGDKLPKITLKNEQGKDVDVSSLAGADNGVVIFLYPKADTPGCTNQACGFRDAFDDISALGYQIFGLSRDTPQAQQKWKTKKNLNYSLLCDPESKLIKRLGAFVPPKNTKRSHFIFEKGSGKLVEAKLGVKPADDPSNCLKFIKAHHK